MVIILIVLLFAVPYFSIFEVRKRYYYWTILKNILLAFCLLDIVFNFMTG